GSAQESASVEEMTGSACGFWAQEVGRVRKGSSGSSVVVGELFLNWPAKPPPATHSQPLALSCRGSPGTPQSVTWLESRPATWGASLTLAHTPYSFPEHTAGPNTIAALPLPPSPLPGRPAVSITIGTLPITSRPNFAGSPWEGTRLNTGTVAVRNL